MPIPKKRDKKCPRCGQIKSVNKFADFNGNLNPRGKYCKACKTKQFREEWKQNVDLIFDGHGCCIYCGKSAREIIGGPKGSKDYIDNEGAVTYHREHMDPMSKGGDYVDDEHNTINVCASCNIKKKDKPFYEWLDYLEPKYRKISRKVYIEKHGYPPELAEYLTRRYDWGKMDEWGKPELIGLFWRGTEQHYNGETEPPEGFTTERIIKNGPITIKISF